MRKLAPEPGQVRPEAIAVMKEIGIDISRQRSKSVDEFAGENFDYVLTVCDSAKESRPITMRGQPAVLPRKLLTSDGKHLHAPRDENDVQGLTHPT